MATGQRNDPYRSFNFRVEIDGLTVGSFSECSGLSSDGDAVDYREGTDLPLNVRKLVGLRKYANISLKRGYTKNHELWDWYRNIVNGVADRRNGTIILMDEERRDVLRWDFENGWINKIEAPSFKATGNEVAIETVEIVHEGLKLAS
ncbi:MAG TPA: phage tail protein [Pyrinomonadaceae bacterium]|jgi:phage tail-like protein|nr:phage tail protein [Pyrinomonadaceae bacterium]